MAEQFVGKASEFKDGERQIIQIGKREIGVFRHEGEFYAYSNICLHQGGPACEGLTIANVEERLRPDKTSMGLFFSEKDMNFVCPWHGYEYDMKTGEHISDRSQKLRKYQVVTKGMTCMSSPERASSKRAPAKERLQPPRSPRRRQSRKPSQRRPQGCSLRRAESAGQG